jgi:Putative Ig domain
MRRGLVIFFLFLIFLPAFGFAQHKKAKNKGPEISAPVTPYRFDGSVMNLPDPPDWKPGDPIREVPRRFYPPATSYPQEPRPVKDDPLLNLQQNAIIKTPDSFTVPTRNFDGGTFTGVNPPDTNGDVGANHYIQTINSSSGTQVKIWDKAEPTPALLKTFTLGSLGSGSCASGFGDPVVLYDRQADRWMLTEFAGSGSHLCVYISQSGDPVNGGWFAYNFTTPNFPDYPKYSVWPTDKDGGQGSYVVTTNEGAPIVYALNRGAMLAGNAATSQRFSNVPPLSGFGFQGVLAPADIDGATAPPAMSKCAIINHRDTEVHGPPNNPTQDFLNIWELDVSWTTPASSTLVNSINVPIAEMDSDLCGLFSFNCFPMPNTGTTLDPLREPVMHRLQYLNHGSFQTLVGDFVTDVDGTNHGGMRWFELRGGSGSWALFQEGLYSIDVHHRWIGGISMDSSGNIAMGYSVSSTTVHPDMRYTGRLSSDPAGQMTEPETQIVDGTASNGSNRWGDYAEMGLDPADDCTFWYTNMYNISSTWTTRIASFKFDSCGTGCPTITLSPSTLPDGNVGTAYNQTIVATGGTPPYTYAVSSGSLPSGLTLDSATGIISGTPDTTGTSNFDITATDNVGCTGTHSYSITINPATCLFCDDFEDAVLDPNWTYIGTWTETGGSLQGTTPPRKAIAIATPIFTGCLNCTIQASMQTQGGFKNRVWMFGWYIDKLNRMELLMKEENDRWILKQRAGGRVVAKSKAISIIDPNVAYDVSIAFDGTQFSVSINGTPLITLVPVGVVPTGTVGFQNKSTTGSFGYINVN